MMSKDFSNKYMENNKRNANLATCRNPLTTQTKRSAMVDRAGDVEGGKHSVGKKSYAYKCKEMGVFIQVCVAIREYRASNPNSSFVQLWGDVLHKNWPFIFEKDARDMYPGNIQRMIDAEPEFAKCWYSPAGNLIGMAKLRLERILERDDVEDGTVIKAYDTLMKYEINDQVSTLAFSDETNETLNNIAQGLRELATGELE